MRHAGQGFVLLPRKFTLARKQRTRIFSPAGSKAACKKKTPRRALLAAESFSILTVSVLVRGIFSALRAAVYHDVSDGFSQSPCFRDSEEKNLVRSFRRCHVSSQERKIFRPPAGEPATARPARAASAPCRCAPTASRCPCGRSGRKPLPAGRSAV